MRLSEFYDYKLFENDVGFGKELEREFYPEEDLWVFNVSNEISVGKTKRIDQLGVYSASTRWALEIKSVD